MLHLFKATVGTARISQRIVRKPLCALWRLGLITHSQSHYNRRDLADEVRVRQLSLSGQKACQLDRHGEIHG